MQISCFGAAEGVTGSCHLLEIGSKRVLLDCGMFQGRGSDDKNAGEFGFEPASLDALVVSHAHLDHIGRIPLLVKRGFRGRIISTRPTFELARLSMLDSAQIIDYDTERDNRKRAEKGLEPLAPLYTVDDVLSALERWESSWRYGDEAEVCEGCVVRFHDAGHILGSSFLEFELREDGERRTFVFSGDLGNTDKPIIRDPSLPGRADVIMLESTYGRRSHKPFAESIVELEHVVRQTIARGGNVLIPTFALERAQELLYVLYEAWRAERIPRTVDIYLDSPMAIDATAIFARSPECFDQDASALLASGGTPFEFEALHYTRHSRDSIAINSKRSGAIILAGSGMCTGGRIRHHLRHNLSRSEAAVVFCGYQADGTLGRLLVNGVPQVKLMGMWMPVAASIHTIGGFSGHAGQETLVAWAEASQASKVMLVHGEQESKRALAEKLRKETAAQDVVVMAQHGQSITLS